MVKQPSGGVRRERVGPRTKMSQGQMTDTRIEVGYTERKRRGINWGHY